MLFPCPSHQKHSFHDPKEVRTRSPFSQSSSCELSVMNVLPSADASRTNRYRTTCPPGRRQHASCLVTYCVTLFFSSSPSCLTLCSLFFFLFLHITLSGMWMHREAEGTFSFVSLLLLIVIKREGEKKKKKRVWIYARVQLLCFCLDLLKLRVKLWCNTQLEGPPVQKVFIKTVSDTVPHHFTSLIDPASAADPVISAGWLTQLV